jgi:hypothetical protein
MEQMVLIDQKKGNSKVLVASPDFAAYYERNFKKAFQHYYEFLALAKISPIGKLNRKNTKP